MDGEELKTNIVMNLLSTFANLNALHQQLVEEERGHMMVSEMQVDYSAPTILVVRKISFYFSPQAQVLQLGSMPGTLAAYRMILF